MQLFHATIRTALLRIIRPRSFSNSACARLQLQLLSNLKSYTMAEASHRGVDQSAESFSKFKRYIKCNVTENPIGGEGMP